ncbi:MAG: protein kinase [Candidatus Woesearchaeota archaeon]|nr:protein kinase [Candidatus Woesearchaeota archaeon]
MSSMTIGQLLERIIVKTPGLEIDSFSGLAGIPFESWAELSRYAINQYTDSTLIFGGILDSASVVVKLPSPPNNGVVMPIESHLNLNNITIEDEIDMVELLLRNSNYHPYLFLPLSFGSVDFPIYRESQALSYLIYPRYGRNLDDMIGRLGLDELIDYNTHICNGLAWLHSQGVVHRDIKPSNYPIFNDVPYLSDFGNSKNLKSSASYHGECLYTNMVGTEYYASPESRRGFVTRSADVYSYGMMAVQMLLKLTEHKLVSRLKDFGWQGTPDDIVFNSGSNASLLKALGYRDESEFIGAIMSTYGRTQRLERFLDVFVPVLGNIIQPEDIGHETLSPHAFDYDYRRPSMNTIVSLIRHC